MLRRLLQATAALAVAAFAVPALAAPPTITSVPFTSGTSTFNECTYNDGVHFYPCQLPHAWNNATGAPVPLAVDPTSLYLGVTVEGLPPITFATPQHVIVDSQTASATAPTLANQNLSVTAEQTTATNSALEATAANQLGTSSFASGQGSVTTTAAQVVAARAARRSLTFYNTGTSTIYLGASGVTTSTGFPLVAGASVTLNFSGALFAVGTATVPVSFFELY
ncbi:MAG: hypothetical protein ACYDD1_14050 [Caulobacteraceae bacterium]